jgi:hypothetical protein
LAKVSGVVKKAGYFFRMHCFAVEAYSVLLQKADPNTSCRAEVRSGLVLIGTVYAVKCTRARSAFWNLFPGRKSVFLFKKNSIVIFINF